jgi:hypothetical protein
MRLLHVSIWAATDPLIRNSVLPKLQILRSEFSITDQHLCLFNRWQPYQGQLNDLLDGLQIHVLESSPFPLRWFDLTFRIIQWQKKFHKLLQDIRPNRVIMHGTPTGVLAFQACVQLGIPFQVESCEPHAQYMADSGAWKLWGVKYWYARFQEKRLYACATYLLPVSSHYAAQLSKQGISPDKIITLPCCIPTSLFQFDAENRRISREKFSIPQDAVVGVYLGKFNGVYFPVSVLKTLTAAFTFFPNYYHLFLTAEPRDLLVDTLKGFGIPLDRVVIYQSPSHEVPVHLAAADFAWSFIKPSVSSRFCSPVKNAEYLASGLPVILPGGIGQDSDLITNERAGAIDDFSTRQLQQETLSTIQSIMTTPGVRARLGALASCYRGEHLIKEAYRFVFK